METRIAEIAPRVYRLSTFVPDVAPPAGFTFNQFLIDADMPLLFHCGPRAMFPALRPKTLAIMHGSSFNGDCVAALNGLGDFYADRMSAQLKA